MCIKTDIEIEKICRAQSHVDSILKKKLPSLIREGVTEKEIAQKLEILFCEEGKFALAFPLIVAFGEGTAEPHHEPSDRRLKFTDPILIDGGVSFEGFCSDCTRMFVLGHPSQEFQEKYNKVLDIQEKALPLFRAGVRVAELDQWVRNQLGKDASYFIHALGHGIGRQIHEFPKITSQKVKNQNPDQELQKNMIVTCEPGIYFKKKFGIRIEDMILITEKVPRILTKTPRTLIHF
jgi:Xaa-Pro aminopeptidase